MPAAGAAGARASGIYGTLKCQREQATQEICQGDAYIWQPGDLEDYFTFGSNGNIGRIGTIHS
jgi:nitrous oxide reductase